MNALKWVHLEEFVSFTFNLYEERLPPASATNLTKLKSINK